MTDRCTLRDPSQQQYTYIYPDHTRTSTRFSVSINKQHTLQTHKTQLQTHTCVLHMKKKGPLVQRFIHARKAGVPWTAPRTLEISIHCRQLSARSVHPSLGGQQDSHTGAIEPTIHCSQLRDARAPLKVGRLGNKNSAYIYIPPSLSWHIAHLVCVSVFHLKYNIVTC